MQLQPQAKLWNLEPKRACGTMKDCLLVLRASRGWAPATSASSVRQRAVRSVLSASSWATRCRSDSFTHVDACALPHVYLIIVALHGQSWH